MSKLTTDFLKNEIVTKWLKDPSFEEATDTFDNDPALYEIANWVSNWQGTCKPDCWGTGQTWGEESYGWDFVEASNEDIRINVNFGTPGRRDHFHTNPFVNISVDLSNPDEIFTVNMFSFASCDSGPQLEVYVFSDEANTEVRFVCTNIY